MVPFERAMVVSYRLSIVTIALSLTIRTQCAVECVRRSNQQGMCHLGANFGEEGVDRCNLNFNTIWWERHGAVVYKESVDIFCRLSTIHKGDRQINRQTGYISVFYLLWGLGYAWNEDLIDWLIDWLTWWLNTLICGMRSISSVYKSRI